MVKKIRRRGVVSSSHVDSHGDQMSKEALEQLAACINCSDRRIRYGVDHRRDFPPLGRLENASVVGKGDYFYVEADFVEYETTENVDWNPGLVMQSFETPFQFAEVDNKEQTVTSISIDLNNFTSQEQADNFFNYVDKNSHSKVKLKYHIRKSVLPDPEIVFKLTQSLLLYHVLKPTVKKLGEKIADNVAETSINQTKKFITYIENTLREFYYRCIPTNRPVTVVFDLPGEPHIELIARTRDTKLVLKGLREKKIDALREEVNSLSKNVKVAKVQFLLSKNGKWSLNYLITSSGQTIGKKSTFKKREQRLNIISEQLESPKK